jgi:hypothetical protein
MMMLARITSLADQLRLVAFEAILSRFPLWMIAAVYEAAAQIEDETRCGRQAKESARRAMVLGDLVELR